MSTLGCKQPEYATKRLKPEQVAFGFSLLVRAPAIYCRVSQPFT
jgi:hypothetical protein